MATKKKTSSKKSPKAEYQKRNAVIQNVEDALDRKLKVEKALLNICLRYLNVNLKSVVKEIIEGELPIVEKQELNYDLAAALGVALEDYDDEAARKEDLADLLKKWSMRARKKALEQKPVFIPRR